MKLSADQIEKIISEVQGAAEVDRRAMAKRRMDIYRDGGKAFLIEKILREFGQDALSEMRLTPINLLKKIVDKRAGVYKRPPTRKASVDKDQALVDHYVEEMAFNVLMQKANKYLCLLSNSVLYIRPHEGCLKADVLPNYLYSIVPDPYEPTEPETFILSAFAQEGIVSPQTAPISATGAQSFSEQKYTKPAGDIVASQEQSTDPSAAQYIFWNEHEHFTTDSNGSKYFNPTLDDTQFDNPIGKCPLINIARDRDTDVWATQGEDMVDLTIALQMGWTDVMTIAKHQGFSILTITSEDQPKDMRLGVNRAVWLKANPNGPQPSIGYVQGNSPLAQYKELLTELLGLLLTTNNMDPGAIGGANKPQNYTSGFHALLAMADSLEAIEADKPLMLDVEKEAWELIAAWHNWMFDNQMLEPEIAALGKFSEGFSLVIQFADVKPLESEDERINRIKTLLDMGLITKIDAIKRLHLDMTDEQAAEKLDLIDKEKASNVARARLMFTTSEQADPEMNDDVEEPAVPQGE